MQTEELPFHVPNKYKVGDRVKVVQDIKAAHAWYYQHNRFHTESVGRVMYVRQVDPVLGYTLSDKLRSELVSVWPSCALELVPAITEATVDVPALTGELEKTSRQPKPRTTSTKKQPWDTAPCTHLRWHLMGLLKEKLKMKVTMVLQADGTPLMPKGYDGQPGGMVTVTTCCVKCGTKMNLEVPVGV